MFCSLYPGEGFEHVEINEYTVNPGSNKAAPQDFELLRLLGKGGYGKVNNLILILVNGV